MATKEELDTGKIVDVDGGWTMIFDGSTGYVGLSIVTGALSANLSVPPHAARAIAARLIAAADRVQTVREEIDFAQDVIR